MIESSSDSTGESSTGSQAGLVKKLYGVPNERGGTSWLEQRPDYFSTVSHNPDHALIVRYKEAQTGTAKRSLNLCTINVQSPYLKDLLRQIFRSYPGETVDEEDLSFDAPFYPFFHRWATLANVYERSKQEESGRPEEIEALISLLQDDFGDGMKDAQNLVKHSNITFALLWTLYPPGCPVFCNWKNEDHCCLVNDAKFLMGEVVPTLALELLILEHDGEKHGWTKILKYVAAYSGSIKIASLPVMPIQLCQDAASRLEILYARGAAATALVSDSPAYKAYEGLVRLHKAMELDDVDISVEGRVMIDAKMHSQQARRYSPPVYTIPHKLECLIERDPLTKIAIMIESPNKGNGLLPVIDTFNEHPVLKQGYAVLQRVSGSDVDHHSALKQHQWTEILFGIRPETFCCSAVRGYCLTSKSWAEFQTDNIANIRWNKSAFDALVIPPARKRLIEAFVRQQQKHKKNADLDDVVQGKGQGLIMLLVGPPGTGKTLTAESIADRLHLPLYAVNANELGDTAKEIEGHFGQVLRLAASWNAVLLLDEADAFLEKRVDIPEARDRNKRVAGKTCPS